MGKDNSGNQPVVVRRLDSLVAGYRGEITSSLSGRKAYIHDGETPGGNPLVEAPGYGLAIRANYNILNPRSPDVVVIGDSITQVDSAHDGNQLHASSGYAEWTIALANGLGGNFRLIDNLGIGGETSSQIAARFSQAIDLLPNGGTIMCLCGTNDLLAGSDDTVFQTLLNNIEGMIVKCLAAGVQYVLVTPPVKDLAPDETRRIQPYLYDIAEYFQLPLMDMYKLTCDPATGNYLAGYSSDGVHPLRVAQSLIAKNFAQVLYNPIKHIAPTYLATYSEQLPGNDANIFMNGTFMTRFAAPAPDNWTPSGADGTTYTYENEVWPYTGAGIKFAKTVDASGEYLLFGTGYAQGFDEGDELTLSFRCNITGMAEATAAGVSWIMNYQSGENGILMNVRPFNGDAVHTGQIIVPQDFQYVVPQVYAQDVGVYTFANLTLTNKTKRRRLYTPGLISV
jgi:lysophospholipase L1-like esterase